MNDKDEQRISEEMLQMWLADESSVDMGQEKTLLEDGTRISHHRVDQCEGNCCLHGTSMYRQCKQPRTWRSLRRHIEHRCPCGTGHPCGCYIDYSGDDGIHTCCGIEGHCPTTILVLPDGVEELTPEQEPVDPLVSIRIRQSAHDYLINSLSRRCSDGIKAQQRLTGRVASHAERIQRLERRLTAVTLLYAVAHLLAATGLYLLVQR